MNRVESWWWSKLRIKRKKKRTNGLTYLFRLMTYLESLSTCTFAWRRAKHDRWDLLHSRSTLRNEGASYTTIEMVVHYHKTSMALRARQLRSYWSRLDSQTQKKEAIKTRAEKKLWLNWITMKERKNTYTGVTLSTSIALVLPWNYSSISVT